MGKRIEGLKSHGVDIVKSVAKRVFNIESEKAAERERICDACPNKVKDNVFGGFMCDECFCPIKNLVHSEKGCPINKF